MNPSESRLQVLDWASKELPPDHWLGEIANAELASITDHEWDLLQAAYDGYQLAIQEYEEIVE